MTIACAVCRQDQRLDRAEERAARRYLARKGVVSLICEPCLRRITDRVAAERRRELLIPQNV